MEEIIQKIKTLSRDDKVTVIKEVLADLDVDPINQNQYTKNEIEQKWIAVAEERLRDYDSGKDKASCTLEELQAEIKDKFGL